MLPESCPKDEDTVSMSASCLSKNKDKHIHVRLIRLLC